MEVFVHFMCVIGSLRVKSTQSWLKFLIVIFFWFCRTTNTNIKCNWCIFHWVMHYFVRFEAKLQGGKRTLERWQHLYFFSLSLLVKSVAFSDLFCIIIQRWLFKNGGKAIFMKDFFSQVCMPVTQSIKDIIISFYFLVLNKLYFWCFHFKGPWWFNPRDMEILMWLHV